MKKLIVFGATGKTGFEVVKQALDLDYEVTAIVRNSSALTLKHKHLIIIKGDVFDPSTFENYLPEDAIIISSLGQGESRKETTIYSQGVRNIISIMKKNHSKRIICVSASALETNDQMGIILNSVTKIVQFFLRKPYADLRIMEEILEQSSLDWTIVRPPQLKDNPLTGVYRTAIQSHLKKCLRIGRADLAQYMLKITESVTSYQSIIEIAY